MTKLEKFIDYITRYGVAYQRKYSIELELTAESRVNQNFLAKNDVIKVIYQIAGALIEPEVIAVGQYWCDSEFIRRCDANAPDSGYDNTYTIIENYVDEFGGNVQHTDEYIDVDPAAPTPDPIQLPKKGSINASDGVKFKKLAAGVDGTILTANSSEQLGLKWEPGVTENGDQTLTNKTLVSPIITGNVTGTAILDEDDMVSDSYVKLVTQQSAKAYVDTEIADVTQLGFRLNIINDGDDIKCRMDPSAGYQKNNALSGDLSAPLAFDTDIVVDTITYTLDAVGDALLLTVVGQTPTFVLGTTLLANSTQTALVCDCSVGEGGLIIHFTDVNGHVLNLMNIPNLSTLSVLVVYSATVA